MSERDSEPPDIYKQIARVTAASIGAAGGGALAGPFGAMLAAAGSQAAVEGVGALYERVTESRRIRAALPFAYAAAETGRSFDEITERLASSDETLDLVGTVVNAAAPSVLEAKLRALGRILANVLEDDARLEIEALVAASLVGIEAPHLRILDQIDEARGARIGPQIPPLRREELSLETYGVGRDAITSLLEARGLVARSPNTYDPGWTLTDLGRHVLNRLHAAAREVEDEK